MVAPSRSSNARGLEGCGFSMERLYSVNISAVNRYLAIYDSECQVPGDSVRAIAGPYTPSVETSSIRAGSTRV